VHDLPRGRAQGGQKGWSGWGPYAVVHGKARAWSHYFTPPTAQSLYTIFTNIFGTILYL
jgi:hypothetical protein